MSQPLPASLRSSYSELRDGIAQFHLEFPLNHISATPSRKFEESALSPDQIANRFPLPWAHHVRLRTVADHEARTFYESGLFIRGNPCKSVAQSFSSHGFTRMHTDKTRKAWGCLKGLFHPRPSPFIPGKKLFNRDGEDEGDRSRMRGGRSFAQSTWAFELKIGECLPAPLGQLTFYLEALDRDHKKPHEAPSIGVLWNKTKDKDVVEYALKRTLSPALVAEYETRLPNKALLQAKLDEFYALAEQEGEEG